MISIREAVENILNSDFEAKEGLARGILNLSQYARTIQERVAEFTKKEVGLQSIVVTLARLEKKVGKKKKGGSVEVRQLAVQSPIVQLVYPKNPETLDALTAAIHDADLFDDAFFSFSSGTRDIALVISEKIEGAVIAKFPIQPILKKKGLSAVSIRFDEKLVGEANVGLALLQKLATKNIVLDAALTTYNEFTLVFEARYLHDAIEALENKG